jgi:Family of unknown function (DUF6892)
MAVALTAIAENHHPASAPLKPTMSDPSRSTIPDPALRAAILSEHNGSTFALWDLDDAALAAWARDTELPDTPLTRLAWRSDSLLHRVWPHPVRDLAGLECMRDLQILDLRRGELATLPPDLFANLSALTAVHLGITATTDLGPLERAPSLRRVVLRGLDEAAHANTRARLESRGVIVDVADLPRPAPTPFVDPNLKLAVLEALADRVELPELIALDEFELDEPYLQRLPALPLSPEQLASVESLTWAGGGMALQHRVWPQFDGESDEFAIRSLAGLEALPNLRSLVLQWMSVDHAPELLQALRDRGVAVQID